MNPEIRGLDRSGDVPGYAILALLCLLVLDLAGGLLPVPEWVVMVLAAVLSVPVVVGLIGSRNHIYVLLFCAIFLNLVADFRSLAGWVDSAANVAWGVLLLVAVLVFVRRWRGSRKEWGG